MDTDAARRHTTAGIERAVARLLGAEASVGAAAVEALRGTERLADGVLLLSMVGASRWGTDAVGALSRLAQGGDPPANWSDYELRIAGEEAGEEAGAALDRLSIGDGAVAVRGAEDAVGGVLGGASTLAFPSGGDPAVAVEREWVRRLCERAGVELVDGPPQGGIDGTVAVARSAVYLDLLA